MRRMAASTARITASLRRERNGPRTTERLRESREHRQVGVKRDLLQSPDAKWGEAVVVLQPPKLALDSSAAPVQILEPLSVARDAGEESRA